MHLPFRYEIDSGPDENYTFVYSIYSYFLLIAGFYGVVSLEVSGGLIDVPSGHHVLYSVADGVRLVFLAVYVRSPSSFLAYSPGKVPSSAVRRSSRATSVRLYGRPCNRLGLPNLFCIPVQQRSGDECRLVCGCHGVAIYWINKFQYANPYRVGEKNGSDSDVRLIKIQFAFFTGTSVFGARIQRKYTKYS